ncbi:adhesion lipoprotein [Listeria floridensis FSL S10-1187]|uniref:Adhesion lipoprotein n=1 Tax=Listeria floridensis FSL S10-1187 TaxID=1265817 RepID=A0ABP3AU35_9LIST|nr:metal ABC transporter substrate-binding protein [Listeria floridensis]EUJ25718.1 adhesion lipoprotein [Listeria floridensis FSL S10-1187]
MNRLKYLLPFFLVLLLLGACSNSKNVDNNEEVKLKVVATNSILADMTKNIAKDKIDLHSIVPVGKDPHEYEPLPKDIRKIAEADLIVYNGINLETGGNAWFSKLMQNAQKKQNEDYFAASDGVKVIYLEGKDEAGKEDPHAWLSLENGMIYAKNIEKQLSRKDPNNQAFYKQNLDAYLAKLEQLDKEAKETFSKLPENKRVVTSEGCFKYFSEAYHIPSSYIWEINTEEEGTPGQIKGLVEQLRAHPIPALFIESSVSAKPMQTVSKDTGIPIYSQVFTDSVAEKGKSGDSYYAMMKWNLEKIAEGLAD